MIYVNVILIVMIPLLIIIMLYSQKETGIEATTPDDLFMNYLKTHPDMCKFTSECNINDSICHSREHKKCETYLEKEWR